MDERETLKSNLEWENAGKCKRNQSYPGDTLRRPGASIPSEAMMRFPSVSDVPPISENFSASMEIVFSISPFPKEIFRFSSYKNSDDPLFSH